ncbi:MAG: double-strand break repair protein AddB [Rhodospirillales bacterium]
MNDGTPPEVYNIGAGIPFVDALAAGILAKTDGAASAPATVTVLLPTRRACRALREAFLRLSGGRPLLLPKLTPLGDIDEEELALASWRETAMNGGGIIAPPAVSGLKRLLLLTRLILAKDKGQTTPDQAARLAGELARLLDQVHTERLGFDGLEDLVSGDFAVHWQVTLDFLGIVTDNWPAILEREGSVDPATRRDLLLRGQAEAWRNQPPAGAVIAAGSTGSIPATADLLKVVAHLPRGCVVLPGLDRRASPDAWEVLEPSHPQYGLARLLRHLGVTPGQVKEWPAAGIAATTAARQALIYGALEPAAVCRQPTKRMDENALAGVTHIDCPGPREEAAVIALIMRRVLEEETRTAALVTPDRGLARRVAAELRRWRVEVDDSAGRPLAQTPPGAFLRLTARMAAENLAPVALLGACKHPLAAAGRNPALFRAQVRRLEIAALRGPRPAAGIKGLGAALRPREGKELEDFLKTLGAAVAPLVKAMKRKSVPFDDLLRLHVEMAEAMAASDEADGAERLWAGEAGEAAAAFVAELNEAGGVLARIEGGQYPALLDSLMAGRVVRRRYGRHPRLHIWGLLEARLQQADTLILGGLNEGTWPPEATANPWMSRPMLKAFGLPSPERRIGLAAHDFAQAFCAPNVVLTRATRVEGTPTVPSRWLLRLQTLLRGSGLENALKPDLEWLQWVSRLDASEKPGTVPPPAPKPPVAARPRQLSVSRVETWIRDPYAIYAERILGLRPLDPLDADPGAAERGSVIHKALERFIAAHPGELPADPVGEMIAIGRKVFEEHLDRPGVRAFWWPRFQRIARWFVDFERGRRGGGQMTAATEVNGRLALAAPAGDFTLTARADRIDLLSGGGLAIIDYKTGQTPTSPQVECGLAPQLPLEAAIAGDGGFEGIDGEKIDQLIYLRLSGGRPAGEMKVLKLDVAETADKALAKLRKRIADFDNPEMPYRSRQVSMFESRYGDYDHLARVKEWTAAIGEGE